MCFFSKRESPSPPLELVWSRCVVRGSKEVPWGGGGSELLCWS